ncbi:MAG TPA: hypothetical protein VGR41_08755 [Actinomycetota bacterium]|nr:hypothetical protein [Actinomycetota bacterium]
MPAEPVTFTASRFATLEDPQFEAVSPVPETLKFPAASREMVAESPEASTTFTVVPTVAHVTAAEAREATSAMKAPAASVSRP